MSTILKIMALRRFVVNLQVFQPPLLTKTRASPICTNLFLDPGIPVGTATKWRILQIVLNGMYLIIYPCSMLSDHS